MPLQPPTDTHFTTFEEGFKAWQSYALSEGYSIIKARSQDKRKGQYTRYTLRCSARSDRPSVATKRKTSTAQCLCQFEATCKIYQHDDKWKFTVKYPHHNHLPSFTTVIHRRKEMTQAVIGTITHGINNLTPRREIYKTLRGMNPTTTLTERDVGNYIQACRRRERGLYTDSAQIIRKLQEDNVWHRVEYRDSRVFRLIWSPKWCCTMWHESPEVVMLDATYKVNAFDKPFFEVGGTTSLNTTFNIAFAMLPDDNELSHTWALQQLDDLRNSLYIPAPSVVITDKAEGTRNAVLTVWPEAQLQLCIWHIMTNVRGAVKERWEGSIPKDYSLLGIKKLLFRKWQKPDHMSEERFEAMEPPPPPTQGEITSEQQRRQNRKQLGLPELSHDVNGVLTLWGYLAHCNTEQEALRHWDDLCSEFFDQPRILAYLGNTYWRDREQWIYCYIRDYHNYGIRSTSRVESLHSELKNYLRNAWTSGLQLYKATVALCNMKKARFEQQQEHQCRRTPVVCKAPMFADRAVKLKVSWFALKIAYAQYRAAFEAYRTGKELPRCSGSFGRQMGMPCRHTFHKRLIAISKENGTCDVHVRPGEALTLTDFDHHWWLRVDLTQLDPLLLVGDFDTTKKKPRKPRKPRNQHTDVVPRWIQTPGVSSSYRQLPGGHRIPCWWETALQEGAACPTRQQRLSQPPPLPVSQHPAGSEWYQQLRETQSPAVVPPVPSPAPVWQQIPEVPAWPSPAVAIASSVPAWPAAPSPSAGLTWLPVMTQGGQSEKSWNPPNPPQQTPGGRFWGPSNR